MAEDEGRRRGTAAGGRAARSPVRGRGGPASPAAASLEEHLRSMRGSLASLRAAAEALAPEATGWDPARAALLAVVVEEAGRLSEQLAALGELAGGPPGGDPPGGRRRRRVSIAELTAALVAGSRESGPQLELVGRQVEGVLRAAAEPLTVALVDVLGRLRRDHEVTRVELRTRLHDGLLVYDLSWVAREPEQWRLRQENAAVLGGEGRAHDLRAAVAAAGGEVWLSVEREGTSVALRLLLPLA